MLLRSFIESAAIFDVDSHFAVRFDLRGNQIDRLIRQVLR